MIKQSILIIAALIGTVACAQKRINPEVFAKTITPEDLKKHLSVIAGAEMEGRNTPSPGLEKAAGYIADHFKQLGLTPGNNGSFRQTFRLSKDSLAGLDLSINGDDFKDLDDIGPLFTNGESVDLQFDEYVFAGYGIVDNDRDDYSGIDAKGKLVVLFAGAPQGFTPSQQGRMASTSLMVKISNARKKGAAAILIAVEELPARVKSTVSYRPSWAEDNRPKEAPVFFVGKNVVEKSSGHSFDEVIAALDNGKATSELTKASVRISYQLQKGLATASNVLAVVEGTDKKDEYLFITAHYDHLGKDAAGTIYYGADDDGSGTVSVLEMAAAFARAKKAGKGPRRSVVFMTVSGEEKGLWGSEYYSGHPVYPLDKTTADLNIDMVGRTDTIHEKMADSVNYVYVIGDDKLSTDLTPITEAVNGKYTQLVLDRKYNDPNDPERIYYRSDHYNFARKGVPIIFYFDGIHRDYHRPTDTIDKINFSLMARRVQLVFYTAWEMANRDEMLKRDLTLPASAR
ncbi:peptidase M28 [Niabella ginsenosidivorans]|uniref:Peptidase M28 n=1 Tax=Niabella ginsenosidivorans TaxID=1176587 RepID=A0A1A9HYN5_9BACT|nr:M28 family peptidase [Niabella ginsenosidivorans]ANH79591.1 peptidase M28 [Niabella ginsenosidivorans]